MAGAENQSDPLNPKSNYRTVRVFISSTFRDMQAERDHLVRFVFPRLREELLAHRIHMVDIDLRWGVTTDQDASEVCREVVDECHPRFLCMLGGRYGWVPEGKLRSITADEIYYGVLDREVAKRGFAYFYFRDDSASEAMVEITPGELRELQGSDSQIALNKLKQAIVYAGLNPFTYQAQWDDQSRRLIGLAKFGEQVYNDLLNSIKDDPDLRERFTSSAEKPDEFAEENAAMEAFVEERTERFVLGSRKGVVDELLAYANGTSGKGFLCLVGEPGSGKSALLAYTSKDPTLNDKRSTLLIRHFVGASIGSTDVRRTLRRLCHELLSNARIIAEIPEDTEKLRVAFSELLKQASRRKNVVILIDAVNQFDSTSQMSGIRWLPEELPDNAHIILSTLPGPAFDDLNKRRNPPRTVQLQALTQTDGEVIIMEFLHRYRKSMTDGQRAMLLAKTDAVTPLYLLAALEELRTLGTYDEITDRIVQMPSETRALFTWILKRLEDDDGFRDNSGLKIGIEIVPRFASLLGVSRHGLSQGELAELLVPGDPKTAIPDDVLGNIAALIQLLRPYLMWRGELLDFYHVQIRDAAEKVYLQTDVARMTTHQQIADYFRDLADPERNRSWKGINPRPFQEMPYHLGQASQWEELTAALQDILFLEGKTRFGLIFDLVLDFSEALSLLSRDYSHFGILSLLEDAIRKDIHFIARHIADYPQALFQCLWNTCWKSHAADDLGHYELDPTAKSSVVPLSEGDGAKTNTLLEQWLKIKKSTGDKRLWLRSLRPSAVQLSKVRIFREHQYPIRAIAFDPISNRVTSCDSSSALCWDADNFRVLGSLYLPEITSLLPTPDGSLVVILNERGEFSVWNPLTMNAIANSKRKYKNGKCLCISKNGEMAAIGLPHGLLYLVNLKELGDVVLLKDHEYWIQAAAFSPDGKFIITSTEKEVQVWDINDRMIVASIPENSVDNVVFSTNGNKLLISKLERNATIFEWDDLNHFKVFSQPDGLIRCVAISSDGGKAATGSGIGMGYAPDNNVYIWDCVSGRLLQKLFGHRDYVECLAFSLDGKWLASGSQDRSIRLWNLIGTSHTIGLSEKHGNILSMCFSPCGSKLVVGDRNYGVRLWSFDEGVELGFIGGHDSPVYGVAFSPNGDQLASCSGDTLVLDNDEWYHIGENDNVVKIWNLNNKTLYCTLKGHQAAVKKVSFSPDGRQVSSSSDDGTTRVWDIRTAKCLQITERIEHVNKSSGEQPSKLLDETCFQAIANHSPSFYFPCRFSITVANFQGTGWACADSDDLYLLKLER